MVLNADILPKSVKHPLSVSHGFSIAIFLKGKGSWNTIDHLTRENLV